uniref:Uncharacterized protein n=1 Tax=Rhizophora mucronata TaxID=61149 RepID=A0A2P2IH39_RHIMU
MLQNKTNTILLFEH